MKQADKQPAADARQREAAIDPVHSFIVQAPAGSGKTELLIQRFLRLLAGVKTPEAVVAITFTRKAAAEMRSRILSAIERAEDPEPPAAPHEARTWRLARAAKAQNDRQNWHLTKNPSRLRIQTIDSLCAAITRQMPFLSRLGAPPEIAETPEDFYQQAARETVAELEAGSKWSPAIEALIRHLDNQLDKIEGLIAGMLARRDQWLRHIAAGELPEKRRKHLEQALERVVTEALEDARNRFPDALIDDLLDLARFAAGNLADADPASPLLACRELKALPAARPEALDQWLGLCDLLLTREGGFRRKSDKNLGFPAPSSAKKNKALKNLYEEKKSAFQALISELAADSGLAGRLQALRGLPASAYSDNEWVILEALLEILRLASAHLALAFQAAGKVDFSEVAIRADQALGDSENPTDLALSMDYQIQHILIDEFQDTSITQYTLLEKMTMGWQPGDGRTFFAVGDPMQSIYGFREAEVGLFIRAWQNGLGEVALNPLALRVNFRSQEGIVDWVNQSFPQIMPPENDAHLGAVAYSPAEAVFESEGMAAVKIYPIIPPDRQQEAEAVLACIRQAQADDPAGSIAVLVRSRPHLEFILKHFKANRLSFTGVEIESLKNRPVIQDLLSLTRAISHPADRIAWLAVLRAPWCGLCLKDLYALAADAPDKTIIELLQDADRICRLSPDGQMRAKRSRDILLPRILERERRCLRRLVEGAWLLLGGPAGCFSEADFNDARAFLDLLDEAIGVGVLDDITAFESKTSELFARPDPAADPNLQVMTIHKAKGLEFDTVILPGLDRPPPAAESRLLMWLERSGGAGSDLLLAPIAEAGPESSKTYEYIRQFEKKKRAYEDGRLLYVAATRAKKRLHLVGGARPGTEPGAVRPPDAASLLYPLWSVVYERFQEADRDRKAHSAAGSPPAPGEAEPAMIPYIRRLSRHWQPPAPPPGLDGLSVPAPEVLVPASERPPFDWAGETVRRIGTLIHRWLRIICEDGLEKWWPARVEQLTERFFRHLKSAGISGDQLEEGVSQVKSALIQTIGDPAGRWILSRHAAEACEYRVSGILYGRLVNMVIDRTFVDDKGLRWIIDYKSSIHRGGSVDEFLDREKDRYQEQMGGYASVMRAMENRPIRLMLYYPQLKNYREWAAGEV
ncbi:MAG: UvrD-helicase domain-containing protein [Desulfobacterales bacterium]